MEYFSSVICQLKIDVYIYTLRKEEEEKKKKRQER